MKTIIAKNTQSRGALNNFECHVLLPILTKALKIKKGKENAVTYQQIVNALSQHKVKANRKSIERVIKHIRMNGLIKGLLGSYNGYYVANSKEELMAYEEILLNRELALRNLRFCMQKQRTTLFTETIPKHTQLF